eukprot:728239-Ditylum_brightwellii.AAC.1
MLGQVLYKLRTQHIELLHQAYSKSKQVQHLESDVTLIPKLSRMEFQFFVSEKAEQSKEFAALQDATTTLITNFQNNLKAKVVSLQ